MLSSFKIAFWHIKGWKNNLRILTAVLLCILMTIYESLKYIEYCKEINEIVNCFETYIMVSNNIAFITVTFFLMLLFFADAPFMDNNSLYTVLRSGRYKWCFGKFIYIFLAAIGFNLLILITTIIISLSYSYSGNIWSKTFVLAAEGSELAVKHDVTFDNRMLLNRFSPAETALYSFALSILYSFFNGVLIFALNMMKNKILGFSVAGILHFVGYFSISTDFAKFMPLPNCVFRLHDFGGNNIYINLTDIRWSLIYIAGLIIVFAIISLLQIRKVDFKITIGERI